MQGIKNFLDYSRKLILIVLITFILTLIIDYLFGNLILRNLDNYLSKTEFYGRLIRIDHDYYHHTLKPNSKYEKEKGFGKYYTFCTDNNGFKYYCNKTRGKDFDYAFIGDSFTEGVALNYEDTFVGIFENKKNTSVANLGVTSYAPNIYLSKIKYYIEKGYTFKNVVVFIDISDLYDDNVFYKLEDDFSVSEKNAKEKNLKIRKFLRYNFPLTNYYMYVIKMNNRLNKDIPPVVSKSPIFDKKSNLKASWTYQNSDFISGYSEEVFLTKQKMVNAMNELYFLLKKNDINLNIAVYPWPQQIEHDKINSEHVNMWQHFCVSKCVNFINFFPILFKEKNETSFIDVYKKYYFWNDVHFNRKGNQLIADKLLEIF